MSFQENRTDLNCNVDAANRDVKLMKFGPVKSILHSHAHKEKHVIAIHVDTPTVMSVRKCLNYMAIHNQTLAAYFGSVR